MTIAQNTLRNIAIIAHVDHGKTTLVDQLFRQSGLYRDNQVVEERLMDSMDLERERGITIAAKNGLFYYKDYAVNIIDTPGHADFGGQVERVLRMADAAILLVDAAEGPMPQTYFVLKKALLLGLPILVVINKVDKPAARIEWVHDQVFDLFVRLNAPDHILDFPVIYASAKEGFATTDISIPSENMEPLFEKIIEFVPPPTGDPAASLQLLVSSLSYSPFLGRLAIGKVTSGSLKMNQNVVVTTDGQNLVPGRITKIYRFESNNKKETETAGVGEIVAVSGMEFVTVGETITDPANPIPLPVVGIDPPTISMNFLPNDSPFSGREGDFVTSRHIKERLDKEILSDVALHVEDLTDCPGYKVSGRGELHLSILIETMRREGYELQVTRPRVIFKDVDGKRMEPYEELIIDVAEEYMGRVIENIGGRKGKLEDMQQENGMVRLKYKIPTRGLLGFKAEFMTETKGMGVMNYVFAEYGPFAGDMRNRKKGVLISKEECETTGHALFNIQERGVLFMGPGEKVYGGQVIGENARDDDMVVNPGKGKKLSNVRSSGADEAISLTPYKMLTLEDCIAFINEDELVEITPKGIRIRKVYLDENERKRHR